MPQRYQTQQAIISPEITTPIIYNKAISEPQKKQWEAAIIEELGSLTANDI
jgi:hypothetical protein